MALHRISLLLLHAVFAIGMSCPPAWADTHVLTDQELTEVSGQGLVTLDNTTYNGLQFSTITFNANVSLNVTLQNIQLGQYTNATNNGGGVDINIPLLQLGSSPGSATQTAVQITDPYMEFIYNNAAGAGNGQVVGMRIGFNGISGNVGLLMSAISGSLQIADGAAGILTTNGYRATSACASGTCIPLSQISGVVAGNASGPSRDFWISMLTQAVQFPAQPGLSAPSLAEPGIWMNWTDRLTATGTSGSASGTSGMALLNMLTQSQSHH